MLTIGLFLIKRLVKLHFFGFQGKSPAAGDEKKTPVAESLKIESSLNSAGQKEQHVWNNADPSK